MTNIEQIKMDYHKEATNLLSGFPETMKSFEFAWQTGKFREAYLLVHNTVQRLEIVLSPEQNKIWEDFYWLFVN
jgi:hypothetical protein